MNTNWNSTCTQLEVLNDDEMITIDGGSVAYDLGHMAGTIVLGVIVAVVCRRVIL